LKITHDGADAVGLLHVIVVLALGGEGKTVAVGAGVKILATRQSKQIKTHYRLYSSVVEQNRLCSDPVPGSHIRSDSDPAPDPNRIRTGSEYIRIRIRPKFFNFLKSLSFYRCKNDI